MADGSRAGRGAILVLTLFCAAGPSLAQQPAPPAVIVRDGLAMVGAENLIELLPGDRKLVRLRFSETDAPVLGEGQTGPAQAMLRRLYAAGRVAGNRGDLYENRDRGHSALPEGNFPQLARVVYGEDLRAAGLDYGAASALIFDAPLLGNSSTALIGALWRSQPRMLLTSAGGPQGLYQNYAAGQIHVYPEHRDHDPQLGDLLPANTPYYLISQGSSGSDQVHLEALVMILAALRPDTKEMLRETGLIAPTVQMVYRRARTSVLSRETYLSGAAHPAAFPGGDINLTRMVGLANAIAPEAVPPMVRLRAVEESWEAGERLFDTPSAIARIWRSQAWRHEMIVSAVGTRDPNGRALRFDWAVLRGDPARTRVEPLDADGRRARITVEWQAPRPVPGPAGILSSRVDIGVFAHNGVHDSAPGFVSVLLPAHERRVYTVGPEGGRRLVGLEKADEGVYVDPTIFPGLP